MTEIGWREDGSYVPCPQCGWTPPPENDDGAPGQAISVMPKRPGVVGHRGRCPVVDLPPKAKQRIQEQIDESDRARRRAWEGAHDHVIG